MLLHLGQLLYSKFETLTEIFDYGASLAINWPMRDCPQVLLTTKAPTFYWVYCRAVMKAFVVNPPAPSSQQFTRHQARAIIYNTPISTIHERSQKGRYIVDIGVLYTIVLTEHGLT